MHAKDHPFERRATTPESGACESNGAAGEGADADEFEALAADLRNDTRRILRSLKRVWLVEWNRLGLRAIDAYFRVAFYVCLFGFGLAATIAASLLVVGGIRTALRAWSGSEWVGEFGGGLVVLVVVIAGGIAVRAHLRNEVLRSTRRALAATGEGLAKDGPR